MLNKLSILKMRLIAEEELKKAELKLLASEEVENTIVQLDAKREISLLEEKVNFIDMLYMSTTNEDRFAEDLKDLIQRADGVIEEKQREINHALKKGEESFPKELAIIAKQEMKKQVLNSILNGNDEDNVMVVLTRKQIETISSALFVASHASQKINAEDIWDVSEAIDYLE